MCGGIAANRFALTSNEFAPGINPEAGPDSSALAQRLGITGYPFVFVVPPGSDQPTKINVFKRAGDTWLPLQPLEFVQACRQAGAS